nr:uncharacterized protein CG7065 isoform X2 [Bombyx mori]
MVERKGRDISGKWIYLCYPCGAVCSGESILQTHISGKKHKIKLAMCTAWPNSIFEEHHFLQKQSKSMVTATQRVLQKMAEEVDYHKKNLEDVEKKYEKYRKVKCHIQDIIDDVKAPLPGIEYLIEHPPEDGHSEPCYLCVLCNKQGHPRTIINHMTSYWHRVNYIQRHFHKAYELLAPYRNQQLYREGVSVVVHRFVQRVEDTYGRHRPAHIDKDEYDKNKESINTWIHRTDHFKGKELCSFEDVVDIDLIQSLRKNYENTGKRDPSPPPVSAPSKSYKRNQRVRAQSIESLSDISDEEHRPAPTRTKYRERTVSGHAKPRHEPYKGPTAAPHRSRYTWIADDKEEPVDKKSSHYKYKAALAEDQKRQAEESAEKTLRYHEKNPEKHPLYPEEWKKFWNKRYKQIQSEGKDPSKHDFKSEWIVFWTKRMKELHDEELQVRVDEIYRRMRLSPPPVKPKAAESKKRISPEKQRPPEKRRSRSPDRRPPRSRFPEVKRRSPVSRRRTPDYKRDYRRERMISDYRRSPERRRSPRPHRSRSRSRTRSRTPHRMESSGRSRSPLSCRAGAAPLRNRSPASSPAPSPAMQTVLISDDDLKPDDLSPWNSDDMESTCSMPTVRSRSSAPPARARRDPPPESREPGPAPDPQDLGPPENIVATLRLLIALEDYLGSLGPRVIDLLAEALKMEKDRPNSSEELLDRESAVVLLETAKEKLKGSVQAGLVAPAAAPAARAALLRAARTLHAADTRQRRQQEKNKSTLAAGGAGGAGGAGAAVPVAGVGQVDRAQIAAQLAAALVAQGKTDVSADELSQLVDAVVGMAEAKRRAAATADSDAAAASTSALQLLQSAYDDNEKKLEKEDPPDAMDGLSDSDLETLLKNFNELSVEEQHSLIAYLKKLEAREPQRVERLRQYVNAPVALSNQFTTPENNIVAVESDDDDYTVDEVFQSATQKVKEDQMRQEMEIVKKSLEETKSIQDDKQQDDLLKNLTSNLSSAAGLLALVQASIQSTSTVTAPQPTSDVVTSNMQPKSFGDPSEAPSKLLLPSQTPQNVTNIPPWAPEAQINTYNISEPHNYNNNQTRNMQNNTAIYPHPNQPVSHVIYNMGHNEVLRPHLNQPNINNRMMRPLPNQANINNHNMSGNNSIPSLMDLPNNMNQNNLNENYNQVVDPPVWNQQHSNIPNNREAERGVAHDYFNQANYIQSHQGQQANLNVIYEKNQHQQMHGVNAKKFRGRGRGGGRGKFGAPRGRGRGRGAPH